MENEDSDSLLRSGNLVRPLLTNEFLCCGVVVSEAVVVFLKSSLLS